jgi:hypothetical protein
VIELIFTLLGLGVLAGAAAVTYSQLNQQVTVASAEAALLEVGNAAQADALRSGGVQITSAAISSAVLSINGGSWFLAEDPEASAAVTGEISVYVRGDVAGLATLVGGTDCVLARITLDEPVVVWSWSEIGGWCRGRTVVLSADSPSPAYIEPTETPQYEQSAAPLTAPANVVATVAGDTVTLSWSRVGGATSYEVRRGTTGGALSTLVEVDGASYTDTDVSTGSYDYAVIAKRGAESSDISSITTASVASSFVVPAPTALTVTGSDAASVTVTWEFSGAGSDGFVLSVDGRTRLQVSGSARTATISGLDAGQSVTIGVRTKLGAVLSSETTVSATAAAAPLAPTNLQWVVSGTSIVLTWDAPTPSGGSVTGYTVYLDGAERTVVSQRTATLTGLVPGVSYRVTITASGIGGESGPSRSVTVALPG